MYFPLPLPAPPTPASSCHSLLKAPGYQKHHPESPGPLASHLLPLGWPHGLVHGWPETAAHPVNFLVPLESREKKYECPLVLRVYTSKPHRDSKGLCPHQLDLPDMARATKELWSETRPSAPSVVRCHHIGGTETPQWG
jgi:hypothetical protein